MVDEFIKSYIKKIVSYPDSVSVLKEIDYDQKICNLTIYANNSDIGRIIGKDGKMISSIKTIVSSCKAKDGMSYNITVEPLL